MKNIIIPIILIGISLASCNKKESVTVNQSNNGDSVLINEVDTTLVHVDPNSNLKNNWAGTYHGTLPCADCEGIQTVVELKEDNTFKIVQDFLNKNTKIEETGKFEWSNDGNNLILNLKENSPYHFKLGDNRLFYLDQDGNQITGNLADQYVLMKK